MATFITNILGATHDIHIQQMALETANGLICSLKILWSTNN